MKFDVYIDNPVQNSHEIRTILDGQKSAKPHMGRTDTKIEASGHIYKEDR